MRPASETSQVIASPALAGYSQFPGGTSNCMSERTKRVLLAAPLLFAVVPAVSFGQNTPVAKKPSALPVGPAAPQSTHYPILLLVFGNDPNWSVRIGQKG